MFFGHAVITKPQNPIPRGANVEGYSIRNREYRYTEWREKDGVLVGKLLAAELYDEAADPHEMVNLAQSEKYQDVRKKLAVSLWEGWEMALPEGIANHSDNPIAPVAKAWSGGAD